MTLEANSRGRVVREHNIETLGRSEQPFELKLRDERDYWLAYPAARHNTAKTTDSASLTDTGAFIGSPRQRPHV